MQNPSQFRNIFCFEENEADWKVELAAFDNKVPRFETKQECTDFMKKHCKRGSNPFEPGLMHSVSMLTDWKQIESCLLPKIVEYNNKYGISSFDKSTYEVSNRFISTSGRDADGSLVGEYVSSRLNLSLHTGMNYTSTLNTLKYMFHHLRCGIYVMIRNKEIVIFAPFVNKDYRNNWGENFKLKSNTATANMKVNDLVGLYYDEKDAYLGYKKDNYLPDTSHWWANGNIICNQHTSVEEESNSNGGSGAGSGGTQYWGDTFCLQIKDMIAETCRCREVSMLIS